MVRAAGRRRGRTSGNVPTAHGVCAPWARGRAVSSCAGLTYFAGIASRVACSQSSVELRRAGRTKPFRGRRGRAVADSECRADLRGALAARAAETRHSC